MRIAIDPGHWSPCDPGAVGHGGTTEAAITMAVSKLIEQKLVDLGHVVMLTHFGETDDYEANELWPRVQRAIEWGADCFVSIHCNGAESMQAHGFETFCLRRGDDSLQNRVHDSVLASMSITDRGKKQAGFAVLKGPFPSVLIELDFVTNPVVEGQLVDPAYQQQFADAIAAGIVG